MTTVVLFFSQAIQFYWLYQVNKKTNELESNRVITLNEGGFLQKMQQSQRAYIREFLNENFDYALKVREKGTEPKVSISEKDMV